MMYLYAATGCVLIGIALIWKATHRRPDESTARFVFGILGLAMLAYAIAICPKFVRKMSHPVGARDITHAIS
jgi:hypothetical protein